MTIASDSTNELVIDDIVLQALRLASLMPLEQGRSGVQWQRRAASARQFLETIVKGVEAEGRLIRHRRLYTFQLTAGTADYVLPSSILDVYDKAIYIPADDDPAAPSTELVVTQITLEEWQMLGSRQQQSDTPSFYWPDRGGPAVTVRLWQTPSEAGWLRVQAYYLIANSTGGADTVDLERHWTQYLIYELGGMLAETSGNSSKALALRGQAEKLMMRAKGQSRERKGFRFVVRHPGPWRS